MWTMWESNPILTLCKREEHPSQHAHKIKNPNLTGPGFFLRERKILLTGSNNKVSFTAISRCKINHHYRKPVFQKLYQFKVFLFLFSQRVLTPRFNIESVIS
jgi:hypothetical protein